MANIFMRFPQGKRKAVTLSYDDGVEQDVKLIDIMVKHGLKGTFNINSGLYAELGQQYPDESVRRRMTREQCQELYLNSGMEIAVHGLTHAFLEQLPKNVCAYEIMQDRINLEKEFNTIIRGMAYPFGSYPYPSISQDVVDVVKNCGIAYARTTISTGNFLLPSDWLRMPATCHHANPKLMELAHSFVENGGTKKPELYKQSTWFCLWGHSYEFDIANNWNVIEEFARYIGKREDIWYATNIEIHDYVEAYQNLVFSMDGKRIYNPSCKELYFETNTVINPKPLHDDSCLYCVKPGETIFLEQ